MVGIDQSHRPVRIPLRDGAHVVVLGATGSGKTVTQSWIAGRLIDDGHGAIAVDPKGDGLLRHELELAARRAGRPFLEWSPQGPGIYNPFSHGTDTEIADKALAGETYSEPHYLRQTQRYLGWTVRTLRAAGQPLSLLALTRAFDVRQLDAVSRSLPAADARQVQAYLDSLTPEQVRGLAGTRDRLAILAESEVGPWLEPNGNVAAVIDLVAAVRQRAVVYFRLDADRRPLLAGMLAAAIVQDLITVSAEQQR